MHSTKEKDIAPPLDDFTEGIRQNKKDAYSPIICKNKKNIVSLIIFRKK